jgi:hypothetical protein
VGRLPEQREGDRVDYRPLLHRDGSVLSGVTLSVRGASYLRVPLRCSMATRRHHQPLSPTPVLKQAIDMPKTALFGRTLMVAASRSER